MTNDYQKHYDMDTKEKTNITVEVTVNATVQKVWEAWTAPEHITQWCAASNDWHAPHAENDVRVNGKFKTVMAARDGSVSFDFEGVYSKVEPQKIIAYRIVDGRNVEVHFTPDGNATRVVETFEAEDTNSLEMQRGGWQAILDSFKKYVETKA